MGITTEMQDRLSALAVANPNAGDLGVDVLSLGDTVWTHSLYSTILIRRRIAQDILGSTGATRQARLAKSPKGNVQNRFFGFARGVLLALLR